MKRVVSGLVLACLLAATPWTAGAASAAAQPKCAKPTGVYTDAVPWAQRLVEADRVWPLTTGAGQTVAVVGTGVDSANAQFAPGQVRGTVDLLGGGGSSDDDEDSEDTGGGTDCDGRGTFAAGIVAAQPDPSTTFAGMAPGARVLPIRYTQATSNSSDGGDPNELAAAIGQAVRNRATVILVVVPSEVDSPALRAAVDQATSSGAIVVSPAVATQAGALSYPTAIPGVVGVGAVNAAGEPVQSELGDHISIAAPGDGLVGTSAGADGKIGHTWPVKDPSFAASYVAGAIALLRSYRPELNPQQVIDRVTLTASRAPSGGRDPQRGWGVLDVYAAVSAELPPEPPGASALAAPQRTVVVPMAAAEKPDDRGWVAGLVVVFGVLVAIAAWAIAAAIRRGRERHWRPGPTR
jgi:membrane-anchored mycosin MYCP